MRDVLVMVGSRLGFARKHEASKHLDHDGFVGREMEAQVTSGGGSSSLEIFMCQLNTVHSRFLTALNLIPDP